MTHFLLVTLAFIHAILTIKYLTIIIKGESTGKDLIALFIGITTVATLLVIIEYANLLR